MGAGFTPGTDHTPAAVLSVRVGGPLSSLRAEAAALYYVPFNMTMLAPLHVFVDNLIAYIATLGMDGLIGLPRGTY